MSSGADDLAIFVARLVAFGPVFYVGLSIIINPKAFLNFLMLIATKIQQLQDGLHDPRWSSDPEPSELSPAMSFAVRSSGLALIIFGLTHVLGLVAENSPLGR